MGCGSISRAASASVAQLIRAIEVVVARVAAGVLAEPVARVPAVQPQVADVRGHPRPRRRGGTPSRRSASRLVHDAPADAALLEPAGRFRVVPGRCRAPRPPRASRPDASCSASKLVKACPPCAERLRELHEQRAEPAGFPEGGQAEQRLGHHGIEVGVALVRPRAVGLGREREVLACPRVRRSHDSGDARIRRPVERAVDLEDVDEAREVGQPVEAARGAAPGTRALPSPGSPSRRHRRGSCLCADQPRRAWRPGIPGATLARPRTEDGWPGAAGSRLAEPAVPKRVARRDLPSALGRGDRRLAPAAHDRPRDPAQPGGVRVHRPGLPGQPPGRRRCTRCGATRASLEVPGPVDLAVVTVPRDASSRSSSVRPKGVRAWS